MNNYDYNKLFAQEQHQETPLDSATFAVLMQKVYTWMALALLITGITSYGVASSPALLSLIFGNKAVFFGLIIAELALVFGVSAMLNRISLTSATFLFILYSVVNGATLASIFILYTMESIGSVFFVTAGMFGIMSVIGYKTKKDLSPMGRILLMGLIGIIIATIVNLFIGSSAIQLLISYFGVLLFVGLTAYDTQKIKDIMQAQYVSDESAQKLALLGALSLYLDFVNLFIYLLRILGKRR